MRGRACGNQHAVCRVALEPVSARASAGALAIEGKADAAARRRVLQGAGTARSGRVAELLEVKYTERLMKRREANVSGDGFFQGSVERAG